MPTTPAGLPYPLGSDPVANGAQDIQDLAEAVDPGLGLWRVTSCTASFTGGTAGTVSNGVVNVGTGNTTITVSNAFSALYDNYVVTYSGGVAAGGGNISLRLGATNTGYYAHLIYAQYASTTPLALVPDNNATLFTRVGTINTTFAHLNVTITTPFLTTRTFVSSQWIGPIQSGNYQGFLDNALSYSAFDITFGGGAVTGGKIRVFGYKA